MSKILVFGHKNPDTDSVCSAIVMAAMQREKEIEAEAVRLGNLNKETQFVLDHFDVEIPRMIEGVEEGQEVMLVDHNEFQQSADGIETAKIITVVDHHRIANFETIEPIFYQAQPVGCTSTILYQVCKINNLEITHKMAGLMLSAIISDTLLFKSPTCTIADEKAAKELSEIADIDINEYGLKMLKAGTDLDDYSARELLELDAKEINKDGTKYIIAQVNTVDIPDVFKRQEELEEEIKNIIKEKDLDLFVLVVTDIINSNSELLALGKRVDAIDKEKKLENNRAFFEGIVSRKKQILPMVDKNLD